MNNSAKSFLKNLVKYSPLKFSDGISKSRGGYREASVACILRIAPASCNNVVPSCHAKSPLEVLDYCSDTNLEVLFMKRAIRPRDKWSGHISFPGGFINENESDLDAVMRETKEELGVDLTISKDFVWLGRLPKRSLGQKGKMLFPHIFLYLGINKEIELTLNPQEVQEASWVNMNLFLSRSSTDLDVLPFEINNFFHLRGLKQHVLNIITYFLHCNCIYFPCIRIRSINNNNNNIGDNTIINNTSTKDEWVVWGLTFNTITHLVYIASNYHIIVSDYQHNSSINTLSNNHIKSIYPPAPFLINSFLFNVIMKYYYHIYNSNINSKMIIQHYKSTMSTTRSNNTTTSTTDSNLYGFNENGITKIVFYSIVSCISIYSLLCSILYFGYTIIIKSL